MNILHIFSYFRPDFTGEGIYFEKMQKHLLEKGVQTQILVVRTRKPTEAISHHDLDGKITYLQPNDEGGLKTSWRLGLWLARNVRRYDAVHMHCQVDRYFAAPLVCRLLGVNCFQSCTLDDSPDEIAEGYDRKWRWLARRLVRLITVYIAISPKLYDSSRKTVSEKQTVLIPQGVQIPNLIASVRSEERRRHGYDPDDIILLFVGGICKRKGVDFLIEAMPALLNHHQETHLLIVGPVLEDDYARDLKIRTKALGLEERVCFAGTMDELENIYQLSDILVFASHQEGFGNVLLEAMAHGLPVVSRRLVGVTDYFIEHDKTGFLFDNGQEYVEILETLIDNPEHNLSIGDAARKDVRKNFEISEIAQRYVDLYTNNNA